mgnify:CR=1 FL=1
MLVLLWRIDFGHIISPGFVTCVRTTQQLCWLLVVATSDEDYSNPRILITCII